MGVTRVMPKAGFVVAASMVLALATASAASAQSVVSHDNPNATIRYTDASSSVDRIVVARENDGSDNWYSFATTPPGVKTSTVNAKAKASLTKRFKGRRLKPGAVIEVRISAPSAIAKVLRITIRKRKAPKRVTLCLPPGASKPAGCG